MPCSTWTTKSPAARLRRSSRNGARRVGGARRARGAAVRARAEDLLLGDERRARRPARPRRARASRPRLSASPASRRRASAGSNAAEARLARDALVPEQRREALGLRLGARGDDDAQPVLVPVRDAPHERVERAGLALRRARRLHGARRGRRGRAPRDRAASRRGLEALEPRARRLALDGRAVQRDDARARRGGARRRLVA